jgi:hypothetical protein
LTTQFLHIIIMSQVLYFYMDTQIAPTSSKVVAVIDAAVALISVGVISTCAISLAVFAVAPKNQSSLPQGYGYGTASQYGYGYGYGYGYNPTPTIPPTTPTSTPTPAPTSTTPTPPKTPRGTTPPIVVKPGFPTSPDTNPSR